MEKSAREFGEWKKQRDRELLQLKKQGRLNAAQLQKLEALHSKQQAVLRRKTGAVSRYPNEGSGGAWPRSCLHAGRHAHSSSPHSKALVSFCLVR